MKGKLLTSEDFKKMGGQKVWNDIDKKVVEVKQVSEENVEHSDFDSWEDYEKHKDEAYFNFWIGDIHISESSIDYEKMFYELVV